MQREDDKVAADLFSYVDDYFQLHCILGLESRMSEENRNMEARQVDHGLI